MTTTNSLWLRTPSSEMEKNRKHYSLQIIKYFEKLVLTKNDLNHHLKYPIPSLPSLYMMDNHGTGCKCRKRLKNGQQGPATLGVSFREVWTENGEYGDADTMSH